MPTIRPYLPTDEQPWLRCRALGFLDTDYYDDVWPSRRWDDHLVIALVAVEGDDLVGLIDITVDGTVATIDTVAIHPDHQHRGLGTLLLDAAVGLLPSDIITLDAWTREDAAANSWYRSRGFTEQTRYLHVYKDYDESTDGFTSPERLSRPLQAFAHARIDDEDQLRARFRRVYICRQYLMPLPHSRRS